MVFDGYDLIVYGTVQSSLISETGWGLTKATAGTIGSMAFVGMMIGAIFAGRMADSWGRRRTILGCAIVFSIFTVLCAFAPNAAVFGALRLLAGIGLGGLVPSANALVAELVPTKWRSTIATLMMSGVPIGGSIAALVGIQLIPAFGWESMFLVAVLALVIVVPLGLKYLPETLAPVSASRQGRPQGSRQGQHDQGAVRLLLAAPRPVPGGQPAVRPGDDRHPVRLVRAGHLAAQPHAAGRLQPGLRPDLRPGPQPGCGGRLGHHGLGRDPVRPGADRHRRGRRRRRRADGPGDRDRRSTVVYLMLVLAGVGTHGTQCLIIAAVASHYPGHLRGTALGWALGTGRIGAVAAPQVGGLLLAAGLGVNSNFLAFAGAAAIAAVLLAAVGLKLKSKLSISPSPH